MINTTEKTILKKELLTACFLKQRSLIKDFNSRIEALLANEGLGNEEEYDNAELAQSSQKADEVNTLNQALEFANEELKVLQHLSMIANDIHALVQPGAIVVTDSTTFFVSVSIEQFEVEGQPYIGVSTKSPLFLSMKEKRKGERFSCNGKQYKIIDIF